MNNESLLRIQSAAHRFAEFIDRVIEIEIQQPEFVLPEHPIISPFTPPELRPTNNGFGNAPEYPESTLGYAVPIHDSQTRPPPQPAQSAPAQDNSAIAANDDFVDPVSGMTISQLRAAAVDGVRSASQVQIERERIDRTRLNGPPKRGQSYFGPPGGHEKATPPGAGISREA